TNDVRCLALGRVGGVHCRRMTGVQGDDLMARQPDQLFVHVVQADGSVANPKQIEITAQKQKLAQAGKLLVELLQPLRRKLERLGVGVDFSLQLALADTVASEVKHQLVIRLGG